MKTMLITMSLALSVGCASFVSGTRQRGDAPFSIQFLNQLGHVGVLSPDYPEYDPALPGFHILGKSNGFVYARIAPTSSDRPNTFILALQAAHKEDGFTLEKPVLAVQQHPINRTSLWMFSIQQGNVVVRNNLIRKAKTLVIREGPTDYFRYDIVGDSVHVTFLPKALALLSEECHLTWTHSLDR